ncbi:MAG: hypothetical protein K0Q72_2334 [Armatimonadetes bacterium]|jgi:hypothetical protein|nr:hypothetical protein [Armatimonadota bacterium]
MTHNDGSESTLPPTEARAFYDCLREALRLAHSGKVALGYEGLLTAQQRAMERSSQGPAWSQALLRCYREAVADYREVFGVAVN